jgi:hypothetical protein
VLDPFGGSGTVALAANDNGRHAILIELIEDYAQIAEKRLRDKCQHSLLDSPKLKFGNGGVKRFLIFILLYPALALAGLFAFIGLEVEAMPNFPPMEMIGWAYLVCFVPAVICTLVDRFLKRVVVTILVGYAIGLLVALVFFDWGLVARILTFALIGAIPAAACSWMSEKMA